jgi:hypothetical protein
MKESLSKAKQMKKTIKLRTIMKIKTTTKIKIELYRDRTMTKGLKNSKSQNNMRTMLQKRKQGSWSQSTWRHSRAINLTLWIAMRMRKQTLLQTTKRSKRKQTMRSVSE